MIDKPITESTRSNLCWDHTVRDATGV